MRGSKINIICKNYMVYIGHSGIATEKPIKNNMKIVEDRPKT